MDLSEIIKELEEEENRKLGKSSTNYKLLLFKYLSKWKWFAAGIVLCLAIAFLVAHFSTPQFQIKATLLLKDKEKGADFSSNAVVNNMMGFAPSSSVENEAEVFKAQSLMIKACQELGLNNNFYVPRGWMRWKEIYGNEVPFKITIHEINEFQPEVERNYIILEAAADSTFTVDDPLSGISTFSYGEKIANFFGTYSVEPNPDYNPIFENLQQPVRISFFDHVAIGRALAQELEVSIVNKLASVIEISINQQHPLKGKILLEKLIEVYNMETEDDKNRTALNTIAFIDEQLVDLTAELEDIEKKAEQFKLRNNITDVGSESQLFLSSTAANRQQISELSVQISVLESIERYITQDPANTAIVPSSLTINDQTLSELIASFNNLQRERERMLRTTQPNNPIVVSLNQQIASLRTNILENIRNIKNGLEISRNSLTETSDQFQSRASRVPVIERELLDISRQQAIKQEHYLLLTRKREEAALSLAATSVTNSKVIDPPRASNKPVKPKKILIYGLGIVLGLAFPIGLIFIRDIIEEKIEFRADIEALTSTKILGEISRSKQTPDGPVIAKNTRNLIAEQFRFIRSNLTAIAAKNNSKVIMVTSGISGEGKTFFSINLAASLGLIGKSVAVLELDLRRPAMLSAIGISQGQGISDYLANPKIKITNIARQMPGLDNVTVFGAGKTTEDPSELMAGDRMQMLISELSAKYDLVIIDTAPVGLVSDAFMLADFADITVFMVRYGHSSKPQIKTIEDIRTNKKFKLPLIVLNDAKMEITYGYGNKYASKYYQKS